MLPRTSFVKFWHLFFTGSFACVMYMAGQVIVQNYFHKKRALASSLSLLGTAAGNELSRFIFLSETFFTKDIKIYKIGISQG